MKRLGLALLLGSAFTVGCGQRLVDLVDDPTTPPPPATAPTLTAIQPQRGVVEGGTTVVITGTGFSDATEVAFGNTAATFNVQSDTRVVATSPAGTGTVNVSVANGSERSNGLPFAYGNAPLVTAVTPAFGLSTGGEIVTITGSGFAETTSVSFGGTAAREFTVDSDSQITATTPAHEGGLVALVVTTPVSTSNGIDFTFGLAPTIESIAPALGPTVGGTVVTLTGTSLASATAVTFGATAVTTIEIVSDTSIRVTTPSHVEGDVDVRVTTRFGTSDAATFTYGPVPALVTASPDVSPTAGGETIVLTGTGFIGATAVRFGSVEATPFTVDSETQITVTSPAGTDSVNVTVVTPYGTSNGQPFRYGDAPLQTSINPSIGLTAGGTSVVITGSRLTDASAVTFDGVAAASFSIDSDTQITAVSPAHAAGAVDVVTTTQFGASNPQTFTYGSTPALTGVNPAAGPTTGGTTVVLTGSNFTPDTVVAFDTTPAASVVVNSATSITAISPAHAAGTTSITVTNAYGTSGSVAFTYGPTPAITTITPDAGNGSGGTVVAIAGSGFTGATSVLFGGTAVTPTVVSDTQLNATSPGGTGAVNVSVTTQFGVSNGVPFTYGESPAVASLSPNAGLTGGGNTVTINGTRFTAASTVMFGTSSVTPTFVSATQLTVVAPSNAAGSVVVTVSNAFGTSNNATYTYGTAPTVTGISPSSGPSAGGTSVTITGTRLDSASAVSFGVAGATFVVINSTTINAVAPASLNPGVESVVVTTPFGTASTSYTYVDAPTVTALNPTSGSTAGGTTITISGTNLGTTSSVTFGGTTATLGARNPNSVTVLTPTRAAGNVDVVLTTAGGSATVPGGYTYVSPPTVTAVSPNQGPSAGGTSVTITGTGFTGATGVFIGGTAVAFVGNSTSITATTPAHAAGAVSVQVTTMAGGTGMLANAYTYVEPGTITGHTENPVTLTGSNLAWLGTSPASYTLFYCTTGSACDINEVQVEIEGPVTSTSVQLLDSGSFPQNLRFAICPAGTAAWSATTCTNRYIAAPN